MIILQNLNWLPKKKEKTNTRDYELTCFPDILPESGSSDKNISWKFKKAPSEEFTYTLVFNAPVPLCDVNLNGKAIGSLKNRHRRHEFHINNLCDENTIELKLPETPNSLGPALLRMQKKGKPDGEEIKMSPNVLPVDFILRDVSYDISLNENFSLAEITPRITIESSSTMSLWVKLDIDGHELLSSQRVFVEKGVSTHKIKSVKIGRPHLWNPAENGSPSTYRADLHLAQGGAVMIDSCNIGMKSLKASSDTPKDKSVIEINGTRIRCKKIALPEELDCLSASLNKIENFIQDALKKGFNTLQLTGANSYGHNIIFTLCDKAGMMIQQDFPTEGRNIADKDELTKSTENDISENLKRLNTHPSFTIFSSCEKALEQKLSDKSKEDAPVLFYTT